ncbi:MAG: glycosyltransferase [Rhodospirillaceae bacterium]
MIAAASWLTASLAGTGLAVAGLLFLRRDWTGALGAGQIVRSIAIFLMLGLLLDHALGLLAGSLAFQNAAAWAGLASLAAGLVAATVLWPTFAAGASSTAARLNAIGQLGIIVVCTAGVGLAIIADPLFAWDARSVWFFQAKVIYLDGGFRLSTFWTTLEYDWVHKHYPKLLPLLAARAADITAVGWNEYAPKLALIPLLAAGVAGIAAVAHSAWRTLLILAGAALIAKVYVLDGYADGFIALFGTAAAGALVSWIERGDRRDLILAAAACGVLLCLKEEAKLFLIALSPLIAYGAVKQRHALSVRDAAVLIVFVPYGVWAAFSADINPAPVIPAARVLVQAAQTFFDPAVLFTKLGYLAEASQKQTYLPIMATAWLAVALAAGLESHRTALLGAVAIVYVLGLAAVYLGTPADFEWHVNSSLERVAMLPALLFWAGVVTAIPPFNLGAKARAMQQPSPVATNARLSVLMPVYNERATLARVLSAVCGALPAVEKEIILVDDCSSDGTTDLLKATLGTEGAKYAGVDPGPNGEIILAPETEAGQKISFLVRYHERNRGKGAALRTAMEAATGDIVVIQDADLEYDPNDWTVMYELIAVRRVADVVYGSRFFGRPHRSLFFHHYMANRLISTLFNLIYNQTLTDIEVCYKMFTRQVMRSLDLTCNDFGIEVEMSAQIALQRKLRIYETAISYYGRTYEEGKKINWRDGLKALWYVVKFRF